MKLGTRSFLFGVHQFVWHPFTVLRAWRRLYCAWPRWWEFVAIVLHDSGYLGCPEMDGPVGRRHPIAGAQLTEKVVFRLHGWATFIRHPLRSAFDPSFEFHQSWRKRAVARRAYDLALGHSRFFAEQADIKVSPLFRADKVSVLFEPDLFYLLRANLSGEIHEYLANAPADIKSGLTQLRWIRWYKQLVREKFL